MLKEAVEWRENHINPLENFDDIKAVFGDITFTHGTDKQNRPLIYVKYASIKDVVMARSILLDDGKRRRFVRWRVQFFEEAMTRLNFGGGGPYSFVEITDLYGIPDVGLRKAIDEFENIMARFYPRFIDRRIYINSKWYTYAKAFVSLPFLIRTDRNCDNITFTGSKPVKILCKFIHPHNVLVEHGGLCQRNEGGINGKHAETDILKPYKAAEIRIAHIRAGIIVSWELMVTGWEVKYGVEFVPAQVNVHNTLIAKEQNIASSMMVIRGTYHCPTDGDLSLKLDNTNSDKSKIIAWRCYFEE